MKAKSITNAIISLAVMTLFGCGGGGSSAPVPPPAGSITISGVAAKGPLNGADVTVFAVKADGTFDRTLGNIATGKTAIDGSGRYSINILTPPAGPVIIEVTGGTYTDEASGTTNVSLTAPIRAIVSAVADGSKIAVTPFTEVAYKKAEGIGTTGSTIRFTKSSIDDSNSSVAKTFGIDNIITTLPFESTNASLAAAATAAQKKYSAALGTFSQMTVSSVPSGSSVNSSTVGTATDKLIKDLGTQALVDGGVNQTEIDAYNAAAGIFNVSSKNQTGTNVPQIVFSAGVLTISTIGNLSSTGVNNVINAIDMTLTLPAGVTVAADVLGEAAAGVILPSSNASNNSIVTSKYTPAQLPATPGTVRITIINVQPGFGIGEFMHINFQGFPTGLKIEDFKLALNVNGADTGIEGGVANSVITAPLTGITLSISDFVGL